VVDPMLMRGRDDIGPWVRCAMCGKLHRDPWPDLAVDLDDGGRWDVCTGDCAREAGITEKGER
jgi:hypothetical protein